MRRLVVLACVALLGIAPVGLGSRPTAAQSTPEAEALAEIVESCLAGTEDNQWWGGVCQPIAVDAPIPEPIAGSPLMQPYLVPFKEEFAATNPSANAEFMVVVVKQGFFALDLSTDTGSSVVVTSAAGQLPILQFIGNEPEVDAPHYVQTEEFLPCEAACPVDPQQPVLLSEGDVAVARAGAQCLWCLLGTNEIKDGETGLLEVFVLLNDVDNQTFSWIQDWNQLQPSASTPGESAPTMVSWAFNPPSTKCGGG